MTSAARLSIFMNKYKPGVPKRHLLLVAALIWASAGGMLGARGAAYLSGARDHLLLRYGIALLAGVVFFLLVFARISLKHVTRIRAIDVVHPCLFSFFNFRSYLMMAVMIAAGVTLRALHLVDPVLLGGFYLCMGTPLVLSAARIVYAFATYELSSSAAPRPRGARLPP